MKPFLLSAALLALALAGAGHAAAATLAGHEEELKVLMSQAVPEVPGKQVILVTVHYKPGTQSAAHTHPGSVFAYVLDGQVVSELDDGAAVTYGPGQAWYEPPGARHRVSRNASKTQPATLLVWMIKAGDQPPVLPLDAH